MPTQKRRRRQIARYYAECTDTHIQFQSGWRKAWQVFDRDVTELGGDVVPIALCASRGHAFLIRDKLNEAENVRQSA